MIVVTGASGTLGRAVLERLLDRVPAGQVAASVRDPQQVRDLAQRGVRVRQGNFADPAGLAHAFEGASRVLVVSADSTGEETVRRHRAAVEAAVAAGARRVVYTSHMGADPTSPFPPMRDHAATEEFLRDAGVTFTSLRNGFYSSTVPMLLRGAAESGELRLPEDGPIAWTTHADLAEAAAVALTDERLDGVTPALTGPAALDMAEVAAIAARVAGRDIRRVVVPDAEYRSTLLDHGVPEAGADMLVGLFAAARRGDFAPADPTLARLLDRPATPLRDFLDDRLPSAR
jgi:NAD(P)H dehydrogenase (quinone)